MADFNYNGFQDIAAGTVFVIGTVLAIFSRLPKQTIENQAQLIKALNGRLENLEDQREEDRRALMDSTRLIGELQGQVNLYKSIPLVEMAENMKKISDSNVQILNLLESGATILVPKRPHTTTTTTTI